MTEDAVVDVPDRDLLTIGALAARARLSPKALRLYDRLGLPAPAHVDEATGYRYYRAGQVERARLVAMLRQLDMPLAEVVAAGDGPAAAELLGSYWADVEAVEPTGRPAYTRITKAQVAHPQILAVFEAVEEWMAAEGLTPAGPCRELYFADWAATGPEDPVCDVAFPVR
ncbi:MerR family transcriptional regulator [Streptomyces sp. NPDC002788]